MHFLRLCNCVIIMKNISHFTHLEERFLGKQNNYTYKFQFLAKQSVYLFSSTSTVIFNFLVWSVEKYIPYIL